MALRQKICYSYNYKKLWVYKRRSSVNSGAWLRRCDDVTGVQKVALQKQKKEKKWRKMLYHCNLICVSPKHGMHGSLRCLKILCIHNSWNLFLSPNRC